MLPCSRVTRVTRSTVPETPRDQIIVSDIESEEEHNNNNDGLSSPVKIQLDLSQLPEVDEDDDVADRESDSGRGDAADEGEDEDAATNSMGAEHSRGISADLRAPAKQPRGDRDSTERQVSLLNQARTARSKPRERPTSDVVRNPEAPQSSGKLSRPSSGKLPKPSLNGGRLSSNPVLPKPNGTKPTRIQRRFKEPAKPRPSLYDLEESPQKATHNTRSRGSLPTSADTEPAPNLKRKRNADDEAGELGDSRKATPIDSDSTRAPRPQVEISLKKRNRLTNDNAINEASPAEEAVIPTSAQQDATDVPTKRKRVKRTDAQRLAQQAQTDAAVTHATGTGSETTRQHTPDPVVEDVRQSPPRRPGGRPRKDGLQKAPPSPAQDVQAFEASAPAPPSSAPAVAAQTIIAGDAEDNPPKRGRARPPKRIAEKTSSSAAPNAQILDRTESVATRTSRSSKQALDNGSTRKATSEESQEKNGGDAEQSPAMEEEHNDNEEAVVGAQQPVILQLHDVPFPDNGNDDSDGESATSNNVDESAEPGTPESGAQGEQAAAGENEGEEAEDKKKEKKEEALRQSLALGGEADQKRFYGQFTNLKAALDGAYHVGLARVKGREERHHIKIKSPVIREFSKACKALNEHLIHLQDAGRPDQQTGELEPELKQRLLDLCKHANTLLDNAAADDERLVEQAYAHAIPKLTRVLKSVLEYFESYDSFSASASSKLSRVHQRAARRLLRTILQLEETVRKFRETHNIELQPKNLIKPVHNEIYINLKKVHGAFAARMDAQEEAKTRADDAARRASLQRVQDREEEMESLEAQARLRWVKKWEVLHTERRAQLLDNRTFATPAEMRERKHLRPIPLNLVGREGVELDANGDPMERVELFTQRSTLVPGSGPSHPAEIWPDEELLALADGLERFAGPTVYEMIFREYCHRDGILRPYNVSQIVAQAVWLREVLIKSADAKGEEVEQYVLDIPDPRVYHPPTMTE